VFKNHPGFEAAPILGISEAEARADYGRQQYQQIEANFHHQPSIFSWKILVRLDFISCQKFTSVESVEAYCFLL